MDKKTKVNVKIFGNDYTLVGIESEEYLQKVCLTVDEKMREIALNPALKPLKISVLTAINLCDELYKTKGKLENALNEAAESKEELIHLRSEIQALEEEKKYLKGEIQSIRRNGANGK